jgi:hypothetical protein
MSVDDDGAGVQDALSLALKTARMLIDAATVRRYYEGYADGHDAAAAHARREMERTK